MLKLLILKIHWLDDSTKLKVSTLASSALVCHEYSQLSAENNLVQNNLPHPNLLLLDASDVMTMAWGQCN